MIATTTPQGCTYCEAPGVTMVAVVPPEVDRDLGREMADWPAEEIEKLVTGIRRVLVCVVCDERITGALGRIREAA